MSPPDVVLDDVPTTLDLPNSGHVGVVQRYDLVSRHRKGRLSPWTRFASLNDPSSLRFSRSWLFTSRGNWCLRYAYSHHGLYTVGDDPSPRSPVQSVHKPPARSPRAYYDHVLTFNRPTSGEFHHLYSEWSSAPVRRRSQGLIKLCADKRSQRTL